MPLARPARGELLHQGRLAIPDAADSPTKKPPINRWEHRYLGEEQLPETLSALEIEHFSRSTRMSFLRSGNAAAP